MSLIVHFMGPTCAGKSTLIRLLQERVEKINADSGVMFRVEAVSVGKIMREKYGESYFRGQAAPEHTQAEAWEIYEGSVLKAVRDGVDVVLVDGQPRDIQQARDVLQKMPAAVGPHHDLMFVWVHAEHETRERRARERSRNQDDLDLALARLVNDYRNCYVVLSELARGGRLSDVRYVSTDTPSTDAVAFTLLCDFFNRVFHG